MSKKYITRAELGEMVGVTGTRTFQRWEAFGLPFQTRRQKNGGKPRHVYERRQALDWICRNTTNPYISMMAREEWKRLRR